MIAHKQIRRLMLVPCSNCLGTGRALAKNEQTKCPECKGKGEVEKWITEIVNDEVNEE
jgi:DnaJ-class molecular chaperone